MYYKSILLAIKYKYINFIASFQSHQMKDP